MLDIKMKGENTSWQEWYEQNPRRGRRATRGGLLVHGIGVVDIDYVHSVFHKTDTGTALVYRCKFYRAWEKMLQRCYSKGEDSQNSCKSWGNNYKTAVAMPLYPCQALYYRGYLKCEKPEPRNYGLALYYTVIWLYTIR